MKRYTIVDLFCGAGGASHSAVRAVSDMGGEVERFIAVNHWDAAIATHQANHPHATHYCNEVAKVKPREAVPSGRVDLLLAGPSCTHHSRARGGRPMEDQMRTGPYEVLHWLSELYVSSVVIENVPEFVDWGPLTASGRPNKKLRGAMFVQFLESLKAMGYKVAWRVLNAADYGDATSRRRLFIIARRSGAIVWPEPTHEPRSRRDRQPRLFGSARPYRSALDIIDPTIKGTSIFNRKRPLERKTMERIMAGFWKYGLPAILQGDRSEQAVFNLNRGMRMVSAHKPVPTIAAGGGHLGLSEFAVVDISNGGVRGLDEPIPTIVSGGTHLGLAEFVVGQHGGAVARPATDPLPTIAADGAIGLAQVVLDQRSDAPARPAADPLPPITANASIGVAQPVVFGTPGDYTDWTVEKPYLVSYYGTGHALSVDDPLDTVTGKPRFALCVPVVRAGSTERLFVDILYRMLQPHELAAAMSFPSTYTFTNGRPARPARRTYQPRPQFANITSEEAVRMIGNAWPGETGYQVSLAAIG